MTPYRPGSLSFIPRENLLELHKQEEQKQESTAVLPLQRKKVTSFLQLRQTLSTFSVQQVNMAQNLFQELSLELINESISNKYHNKN